MKKIISVLLLFSFCFLFSSCGRSVQEKEQTFYAMDTLVTLRLYGCSDRAEDIFSHCLLLTSEIEQALSATVPDSDISRINATGCAGDLSLHTDAVLRTASEILKITDGAYLPTMGAISALFEKAGEENRLPDNEVLAGALHEARKGFSYENGICRIHGDGALLDLGGVGKGYAMDVLISYLREQSVPGAILSFGSSVSSVGDKGKGKPFTVSLRDPFDRNRTAGRFSPFSGCLSVSGDYERYVTVNGVRYHHVLDPATGYPSDSGLSSVAVLCDSGAVADALSTAFLVLGADRTLTLLAEGKIRAEAVLISSDGQLTVTDGLQDIFEEK